MPSPLAHAGVIVLLGPALGDAATRVGPWRRRALLALVVAALLAPDLDFLVGRLGPAEMRGHGMWMHSLAAAVVFGALFALAVRALAPIALGRAYLVGVAAYGSHVVMDAMTRGRGVALWWPFYTERVRTPWTLFYGLHHSQPWAVHLHAITLLTEGLFVLLLWLAARWWFKTHAD